MVMIKENILKHQPDVLIAAGDITHFTRPYPTIHQLNSMPVPVLAIRGNTDLARAEGLFERFSNISPLHLKKIILKSIHIVGLSGTLPLPFASRICLRENDTLQKIARMLKKDTVLVAHPPPWGLLDEVLGRFHAGSRGLKKIILSHQPRLVICGHIHERPGTAFIGDSQIVNCSMGRSGAGAIIDVDVDHGLKVEMI